MDAHFPGARIKLEPKMKLKPFKRKEVKYLGIIFDDNVTWKAYVETWKKKGLGSLWTCQRLIGRTWGLTPKMTLGLYIPYKYNRVELDRESSWTK